jgi:hypothetical protein
LIEASGNFQPLCPAEEGLSQLMPLEQPVDMNWILAAEALVTGILLCFPNCANTK